MKTSKVHYSNRSLIAAVLLVLMLALAVMPAQPVQAASSGPNNAGSGVNNPSIGSSAWIAPGEITTPGAPYAQVGLSNGNPTSNFLQGTNFGFNIPSGSTINGITVVINRQVDATGPTATDNVVRLVKGGSILGESRASGATWPTTIQTATYGGPTDLWGFSGLDAWTAADINAGNFGVVLSVTRTGGGGVLTASVDFMQILVTYTLPNSTTTVNCGPNPVAVHSGSTCTATVTRNGGDNTPGGSVTFSSTGTGTFTPAAACTLTGSLGLSTCSVTYTPTAYGSGSHTVSASYAGDTNFGASSGSTPVGVNRIALTVTGITALNKEYDGTTTATLNFGGATLVGIAGQDVVTLNTEGATGAFGDKNIANGKTVTVTGLALGGADAGNYTLIQPTTTANITPKTLTVTGILAFAKFYSGTTSAILYTVNATLVGVVAPDVVTLNTTGATGAFSDKYASAAAKTVTVSGLTLGGADAGNYTLIQPTTTSHIYPKVLTVSGVTAANKVYDGTTVAVLDVRGAALVGVVSPDAVSPNTGAATGAFGDKTVADGKTVTVSGLTLEGADAGNYAITQPTTTASITPKALTVTGITALDKEYDGTTTATLVFNTPTLTGVVSPDAVSPDTAAATGTFSNKNVADGKTVTVAGVTLSGADAGNYILTQPTTTASITPKGLTVTGITAADKEYNGTTAAMLSVSGAAPEGVVAPDVVTINTGAATGAFSDKNVGDGKTVTVTGLTLLGTDAGNYTLTQPTTTANITPKALTVVATGVNRVYNGTMIATVTLSDDRLSGDVLTATYTSATFADKNVGSAKPVSVSGISISGLDAGNYTANTSAVATADITVRTLTVSATGVDKPFDGNTIATVTLSDDRVAGDDITTSYTSAAFADPSVGMGKTVSVNGISISGLDAGNYTFNTSATTTANITGLVFYLPFIGR